MMDMSAKGISPMIAVVLLVAFTVAVGGILSLWLTNYVTTTTGSVQTATENQTACVGTYPKILSVTETAVIVTNPGTENMNNLLCYSSSGKSIYDLGNITNPLTPGLTSSVSWGKDTNTSVICTGTCRGIGVTGECKSTQSCWT